MASPSVGLDKPGFVWVSDRRLILLFRQPNISGLSGLSGFYRLLMEKFGEFAQSEKNWADITRQSKFYVLG